MTTGYVRNLISSENFVSGALLASVLFLSSDFAYGACSSPAGIAGSRDLQSGVVKYCDGTTWQPMYPSSTGSLTDGANISVDASIAQTFDVTIAGNRTMSNPTNLVDGRTYTFRIKQDATGGRTLAWGSNFQFMSGGSAVNSLPNGLSVFSFASDGTKLYNLMKYNPNACASGSQSFNATGANQNFVVPAGCGTIIVKAWGAAGGGANNASYNGGGGGFAQSTLVVTAAETLTVIVGKGGLAASSTASFGGGGAGPGGSFSGGAGGGRTAVRRGATELITAGGGGGGSWGATGGAGGGTAGTTYGGGTQGMPGTTSAGGAGASAGTAFQGGVAPTYGGGGGGGYYGGGSGGTGAGGGSGGGGGANYAPAGTVTNGSGVNPANTSDPDYLTGIGLASVAGGSGSDGYAKIYYSP